MRPAPLASIICECAKIGLQVVLIASLTAFWVDLMVRGWQHCGDLKVVNGTMTGTSGTADRRNLRRSKSVSVSVLGDKSVSYVGCHRDARRRLGLVRSHQRQYLQETWRLHNIVFGTVSHGATSSATQAGMMSPPVGRLLQEFLFGGEPLSPPCAGQDEQTRKEAQECFSNIMETPAFQNVAARIYSGQDLYLDVVDITTEYRNDRLWRDALAGVCRLNFIALSDAPGTSLLLLLKISHGMLPEARDVWEQDSRDHGPRSSSGTSCGGEEEYASTERRLQRLRYITGDLRAAAVDLNQVCFERLVRGRHRPAW